MDLLEQTIWDAMWQLGINDFSEDDVKVIAQAVREMQ
jgi:hypothetical protein